MPKESKTTPAKKKTKGKQTKSWSRVQMGSIMGLFLLFVLFSGGWWWTGATLLTFVLGFEELQGILKAKKIAPSRFIVTAVGIILILLAHFEKTHYFLPTLTLGIIGSFIRLIFRKPPGGINDISGTFLALLYIAFLPMHFILLRNLTPETTTNTVDYLFGFIPLSPGLFYVLSTCLVIAMSDIGAYYFGKSLGKHALCPDISPKKTIEGSTGGLIIGMLAGGLAFTYWAQFDWLNSIILSGLLVIASQLGDLAESLMKRDAGVKDSGQLLQSHGGVLDRVDSYLFSGALSYYYIHWVVLGQGLAPELLPWLHH